MELADRKTFRANYELAESIAAISAKLWLSEGRWELLQSGILASGHVDLFELAIDAAVALETILRLEGADWGDDYDWILSTDEMAANIYYYIEKAEALPREEDLLDIARSSLVR